MFQFSISFHLYKMRMQEVAVGVVDAPLVGELAGAVLKAGVHRAVVVSREELLPLEVQVLATVPPLVPGTVVFVILEKVVGLSSRGRVPREEALAAAVA
jgi:hypothetical protein